MDSIIAEDQRKTILDVIETRKAELRSGLVDQILGASGEPVLKDFDWRLKMVLSSDKVEGLNEPLVSLDLSLGGGGTSNYGSKGSKESKQSRGGSEGKESTTSVSIEMNRPEVNKLIKCLEEAQTALQRTSTK